MAAVELLIGHRFWLGREDFVERFVEMHDSAVGGTPMALLDWKRLPGRQNPSPARSQGGARRFPSAEFTRFTLRRPDPRKQREKNPSLIESPQPMAPKPSRQRPKAAAKAGCSRATIPLILPKKTRIW